MEPMLNLGDLLLHEVEDLYSAEEQIIEALPKMAEKASNKELKNALNNHLSVTREQKSRLETIKNLLGEETKARKSFLEKIFGGGSKCKGTEGLIKEGEKMMSEEMDPKVMDAAIIASCQKIEHYEISGYGTARAFAIELGLTDVAKLLETTLNEEYQADDSLTALAVGKLNVQADSGSVIASQNNSSTKRSMDDMNNNRANNKNASSKGAASKKAATKKGTPKKTASKKSAVKKGRRASAK